MIGIVEILKWVSGLFTGFAAAGSFFSPTQPWFLFFIVAGLLLTVAAGILHNEKDR